MAEQSSTVAAFRALVMLICVTVIAVAAFCGGSFPAVVKAIQKGQLPTLEDFRGPSGPPSSPRTEAPRYAQTPSPSLQPANSRTPGSPMASAPTVPQGVIAANFDAPIASTQSGGSGLSTGFPQNNEPATGPARRLAPVGPGMGNLVPLDRQVAAGQLEVAGFAAGPSAGLSRDQQVNGILDRLRQLGATYFLLETWGEPSGGFRFYCKMPIGGNPQVTQPFQCIDGDAMTAMTQVLKEVEDWQKSGG